MDVCGNDWDTNTRTRSDTLSGNKRVLEQEMLALVSTLIDIMVVLLVSPRVYKMHIHDFCTMKDLSEINKLPVLCFAPYVEVQVWAKLKH